MYGPLTQYYIWQQVCRCGLVYGFPPPRAAIRNLLRAPALSRTSAARVGDRTRTDRLSLLRRGAAAQIGRTGGDPAPMEGGPACPREVHSPGPARLRRRSMSSHAAGQGQACWRWSGSTSLASIRRSTAGQSAMPRWTCRSVCRPWPSWWAAACRRQCLYSR